MKKRYKPFKLLAYEALLRRLLPPYRHNETIGNHYLKLQAGYQGEKNMDYKLALFPDRDFIHLPDIRLQHHHASFQMDSILLTSKLIFILEAKHMKGILEYHGTERQLVQVDGTDKKGYKDPILQAKTQAMHLQYWLEQRGWHIPIETLVVSTNQYAIIKNIDHHPDFTHHFVTLENLLFKLNNIFSTYQETVLQPAEKNKLAHLLTSHHRAAKSSLIQQLKVKDDHLIKGIACPKCAFSPLMQIHRAWYCSKCKYDGEVNYQQVVLDHFLMYQHPFITNQMCRDILKTKSPHKTYHLLQSMKLKTLGNNRGRKYLLPSLNRFPQNSVPRQFEYSIFN